MSTRDRARGGLLPATARLAVDATADRSSALPLSPQRRPDCVHPPEASRVFLMLTFLGLFHRYSCSCWPPATGWSGAAITQRWKVLKLYRGTYWKNCPGAARMSASGIRDGAPSRVVSRMRHLRRRLTWPGRAAGWPAPGPVRRGRRVGSARGRAEHAIAPFHGRRHVRPDGVCYAPPMGAASEILRPPGRSTLIPRP